MTLSCKDLIFLLFSHQDVFFSIFVLILLSVSANVKVDVLFSIVYLCLYHDKIRYFLLVFFWFLSFQSPFVGDSSFFFCPFYIPPMWFYIICLILVQFDTYYHLLLTMLPSFAAMWAFSSSFLINFLHLLIYKFFLIIMAFFVQILIMRACADEQKLCFYIMSG